MLDYVAWVRRLQEFLRKMDRSGPKLHVTWEVQPPASESIVREVEERLGFPVPHVLRQFAAEASAGVRFSYGAVYGKRGTIGERGICGGAVLCDLSGYERGLRALGGWVSTWQEMDDSPSDAALARGAFPFLWVPNADCLGLLRNSQGPTGERKVVYLAHDGGGASRVLADSFDEFLETWEDLCYIDILHVLDWFVYEGTGFITAEPRRVRELRQLLNVEH